MGGAASTGNIAGRRKTMPGPFQNIQIRTILKELDLEKYASPSWSPLLRRNSRNGSPWAEAGRRLLNVGDGLRKRVLKKSASGRSKLFQVQEPEPEGDPNFFSLHSTFTIHDRKAANPLMEEILEVTKTEPGCLYCGFTVSGNTLVCREAYADARAVLAHRKNVRALADELLADGVCSLDAQRVHGPSDSIHLVKEASAHGESKGDSPRGDRRNSAVTEYFEVQDGGFNNMRELTGTDQDGGAALMEHATFFSLHPTFTILDRKKAEPIIAEFVANTKKNETGCLHYAWSFCGDKASCREAYVDAAAVNAHLDNVGPCITQLLAEGVATLEGMEIHGPADQMELVKPGTEARLRWLSLQWFNCGNFKPITAMLGKVYYDVLSGFSHYSSPTKVKTPVSRLAARRASVPWSI